MHKKTPFRFSTVIPLLAIPLLALLLSACNGQNKKPSASAALITASDTPKISTQSETPLPLPNKKPYHLVSLESDVAVNVIENPDIDPLTGKPLVPADKILKTPDEAEQLKHLNALNASAIKRARAGQKIPFSQRAHLYDAIIKKHAKLNGIPYKFARAVIFKESGFRVNALGSRGEIGLMQVKPSTAREMGFQGTRAALYDPETNIKYGMRYLSKAKQKSDGSLCGIILKYNAGLYAKRMNKISAAYCRSVKASMAKGI